jgi:hypothetical protein
MREILGNKLSSRQRKDLDKVSETTGVNLRSCRSEFKPNMIECVIFLSWEIIACFLFRRQFDNAKRIFKATEEMTGSMHQNIKTNFLLSDDLTK